MTEHVTVHFRFRRWAIPVLVTGGLFGLRWLTDLAVIHGTYFDYGH